MPKISLETISPYQQHLERWRGGCGNEICSRASAKCFGRGQVPCDVLFLGEGPGESENVVGQPFVGPAGKLLDMIIKDAMPPDPALEGTSFPGLRIALTNLTLCIPREEESNSKATEPSDDEVKNCRPRLEEFIKIADPRLIVAVGKLAADYLRPGFKHSIKLPKTRLHPLLGILPVVEIVHPAAILRAPAAQQGLMKQRATVVLRNAVEKLR